jgi:hypothetical protein
MRKLESLIQRLRSVPSTSKLPQQLRSKHDAVKAHDGKQSTHFLPF